MHARAHGADDPGLGASWAANAGRERAEGGTRPWKRIELAERTRRKREAERNPGMGQGSATLHTAHAPGNARALKSLAWDEARTSLDYQGHLPVGDRMTAYPNGYFVAVELGFAYEHRPSLLETMGGMHSIEDCQAKVEAVTHKQRRMTGKLAQKAVRAKVRQARRAMGEAA